MTKGELEEEVLRLRGALREMTGIMHDLLEEDDEDSEDQEDEEDA